MPQRHNNMTTTFNAMPQRGMTTVASRFNGWYKIEKEYACRRYATGI